MVEDPEDTLLDLWIQLVRSEQAAEKAHPAGNVATEGRLNPEPTEWATKARRLGGGVDLGADRVWRGVERGLATLHRGVETLEDPAKCCLRMGAEASIEQVAIRVQVVLELEVLRSRRQVGCTAECVHLLLAGPLQEWVEVVLQLSADESVFHEQIRQLFGCASRSLSTLLDGC